MTPKGFARAAHRYTRTVDLRYFGQAYEVRVPAPDGAVDEGYAADLASRFHDEHRALYGYDFRDDPRQQVEWVNLRVTGIGPITRPVLRRLDSAEASSATSGSAPTAALARSASTPTSAMSTPTSGGGPTCSLGTSSPGPAVIEEFGSTAPVHPGFGMRVDSLGNLVITKSAPATEA